MTPSTVVAVKPAATQVEISVLVLPVAFIAPRPPPSPPLAMK